jgi:hypothetical protein
LQKHSFTEELPGFESAFCGHALQLVSPVWFWYWPAWHALHVDDAVAAVTLLYAPAPHAVHCAAVSVSLKNPGSHGTQ